MKLGIIQGRLSPKTNNVIQSFPINNWRDEFRIANELGLIRIEWLFDSYFNFNNPIFNSKERKEIIELKSRYNIAVDSLCADYFRDNPLKNFKTIKSNGLFNKFKKLVEACESSEIKVIMIPYVDYSRINTDIEVNDVIASLIHLTEISGQFQINISLETNLKPDKYKSLLLKVNSPYLKINYDSGDSAALGNSMIEEFEKLSNYFVQIHIKDRIRDGRTVPLGEGDVDFKKLFALIKSYRLNIPLNLQTARELEPINNAKKNIEFINKFTNE